MSDLQPLSFEQIVLRPKTYEINGYDEPRQILKLVERRKEGKCETSSKSGFKSDYERGIKRAKKKEKESLSKNKSFENVGASSLVFGSSRHDVGGIFHWKTH
mmetsp:Transcript_12197/g.28955  ORF Transcript_12197/g.28955 Transcript_12197/m.28955 type:complete len:102 (+) Transcript_12197:19-324(+)